jgi:Ca2+-binding EF-hand superfamily protein
MRNSVLNDLSADEFKALYQTLDSDNSSLVTVKELVQQLRHAGIPNRSIDDIVFKVDSNRDGIFSFDEFCTVLRAKVNGENISCPNDVELKSIFQLFDQNGEFDSSLLYVHNSDGVSQVTALWMFRKWKCFLHPWV